MSDRINYGIDLGTTNSAIAKYEGDAVRVFKNRDQMEVTPSVVRIEKTGRILVGRRAYQTLFSDPENVAAEFKRWIGQSDKKQFSAAGRSLSAEELSAEVLKSLIEDARRQSTDPIESAVITVPAAFGQLQCEATARAAVLAGLFEAPLLQEPLAASVAYGMKPDARDKRWLVYDLGGGTFDIAVLSTKDGRLSVLDHRGDNMLGGKDFDRMIVENILWTRLEESFELPTEDGNPSARRKLIQLLRGKAEEAKIDLSVSDRVAVSIFDVGNDSDGTPIEDEIVLMRTDLNNLIEPYIARTISLCKETLTGARISPAEIAAIILVGGPTQMPIVREMLSAALNAPLEFSIDPITVVARGAAIYASTLPSNKVSSKAVKAEAVEIELAYEAVWSEVTCLVAGRINNPQFANDSLQILMEAETGHWNSGWLPVQNNYFETKVHLLEGKTTRFWIYLRDKEGKDLTPTPDSFSIRHGLTLAEPPLPHSIGAEIVSRNGRNEIDILFQRSTPLPAEKRLTYKANKTLKPGATEDCLAIKIWEGESTLDPDVNTFVGVLKISAKDIGRTIPEGADIELSININASRQMKVHAFVPVIYQHFEERHVYMPEENQEDLIEKAKHIRPEIDEHYRHIKELEEVSQEVGDTSTQQELNDLRTKLDELNREQKKFENQKQHDPDDAKRVVQQSKEVRISLNKAEPKIGLPVLVRNLELKRSEAEEAVKKWGEKLEQKEYELLCKEIDRHLDDQNEKQLERLAENCESLKWRIYWKQDWFWKYCFDAVCQAGHTFTDVNEAHRLIAMGQVAVETGDGKTLREVVRKLWDLQPKSEVEVEKAKALEAGIKRKFE